MILQYIDNGTHQFLRLGISILDRCLLIICIALGKLIDEAFELD